MIDTELPATPLASGLTRGFAACLASVTEVPVTELPLPDADLSQLGRVLTALRGGTR